MPIARRNLETVNLPVESFREREPVWIEFAPDAWPDQRLDARFTWNPASQRYSFSLRLVGYENRRDGEILAWVPIHLDYPYFPENLRNHLRVLFHDPTGTVEEVTPQNLGDPVEMTVWPGPESPAYEPYDVSVDELGVYDPDDPPEPWMPPLDIIETDVY